MMDGDGVMVRRSGWWFLVAVVAGMVQVPAGMVVGWLWW